MIVSSINNRAFSNETSSVRLGADGFLGGGAKSANFESGRCPVSCDTLSTNTPDAFLDRIPACDGCCGRASPRSKRDVVRGGWDAATDGEVGRIGGTEGWGPADSALAGFFSVGVGLLGFLGVDRRISPKGCVVPRGFERLVRFRVLGAECSPDACWSAFDECGLSCFDESFVDIFGRSFKKGVSR